MGRDNAGFGRRCDPGTTSHHYLLSEGSFHTCPGSGNDYRGILDGNAVYGPTVRLRWAYKVIRNDGKLIFFSLGRKKLIDVKKIWDSISKDLWIVLLDIVAVNAAYFLALLVRFYVNFEFRAVATDYYVPAFLRFAPIYTVLCFIVFVLFRLYGGMWRFAGINDMNRIIGANLVTAVLQIIGTTFIFTPEKYGHMPITYYVIGTILQFLFVSLIRFGYRILLVEKKKVAGRNTPTVPTMIIGAGETARKAIHHLEDTPFRATVVVDEKSAGKSLDGINVVSDFGAALSSVRAVFIADPNLTAEKRKEIKEKCDEAGIELQDYTGYLANLGGRIPTSSLLELMTGKVTLVIDGKEMEFSSGEEALKSLKDRYDIKSISGATIELVKPSSTAYVGYDAWAQQHKEQTGEDVSFF